jgi:hypothetical protein
MTTKWWELRSSRTGVLVILLSGAYAPAAGAQPGSPTTVSPEDVAQAAALFKEAKALAQAEKIGPACDKFAESQRLDPHLGTLIYLATCHELLGKTASAWVEFTRAADQASRSNEPAREQLARTHAAALEGRLSKIQVQVRVRIPDLRVELNGRQKDPATLADPFPMDPGEYTVKASAPDHLDWVRTITVAPGPTTLVVDVPPLSELPSAGRAPAPEAPAPAPPPTVGPRGEEQPPGEPAPSGAGRTVGIVLGASGLVGIGLGSYFGLTAFALRNRANNGECIGHACDAQGLSDHNNENTFATVSTVCFGVGLAALVAGTYLFFSAPRPPHTSARRTWIAPQVGSGTIGIAGGAAW